MNDDINYKSNPLHGVSTKQLLADLIDHYGFEILHAYLNFNCFKSNPSIGSSLTFFKKTEWAREKLEEFYLYQYKNLPKASYEQSQLSPRDRVIPSNQKPSSPAELNLEDAKVMREIQAKKAANYRSDSHQKPANPSQKSSPTKHTTSVVKTVDPWAKSRK